VYEHAAHACLLSDLVLHKLDEALAAGDALRCAANDVLPEQRSPGPHKPVQGRLQQFNLILLTVARAVGCLRRCVACRVALDRVDVLKLLEVAFTAGVSLIVPLCVLWTCGSAGLAEGAGGGCCARCCGGSWAAKGTSGPLLTPGGAPSSRWGSVGLAEGGDGVCCACEGCCCESKRASGT
jgi:hypothetical protein